MKQLKYPVVQLEMLKPPKFTKNNPWLRITILLTGSLTVLAGAVITAAIPEIRIRFAYLPEAEFYSKLLLTIPSLFIAFMAPVVGRIIDHIGRKKPLLFSLFLYALGGTSGFYLENIYMLMLGRGILGIAVAGIMTINTTLIGDIFQGKERSNFLGWQGAFMGFGGVAYVSIGGVLADISWHWPFLVYGVSLVLLVMTIKYVYEPIIGIEKKTLNQIKSRICSRKNYLVLYLSAFFGMLFFYLIPTQIPFLLHQGGHVLNSTIGFSISASVLAGALVALNFGKIRRQLSFYQIYTLTFILMGVGYLMISVFTSYPGILAGLIISGFGTGLLMPNTNLGLISIAPIERRGAFVGYINMAVYSGQFLSPIVFYPVNQLFSIGTSFSLCGMLMIIMAFTFHIMHLQAHNNVHRSISDK